VPSTAHLLEIQNNRFNNLLNIFDKVKNLISQEVCVAKGTILQLLFCDPKTGKISVICSSEVFGIIRSLLAFRLTGSSKGLKNVLEKVFCFKFNFLRLHRRGLRFGSAYDP
jgi:hypothetical protein